MKKIPIFFSFDNNYVPQASVAFESLLTNAKENIFYELYVIHKLVSVESQDILRGQVSKFQNATLDFVDVSGYIDIDFSDEKFSSGYAGATFTVDTLYRCIPSVLSAFDKYEKIIYSDVDIVVMDDISEIYDIDLSGAYLASFKVPKFLEHEISHLSSKFQGRYFGGGLWVMNLRKMREDNLGERVLSIIRTPPTRLIWQDQDVMNLACDFKVKFFSYRYVSIPGWLNMLIDKNFYDDHYPDNELYDAMYRPKIIHYAGAKPWAKSGLPPKSDLWYYWLSKTPFAGMFEENRAKAYKNKLEYKVYLFGFIPLSFFRVVSKRFGRELRLKFLGVLLLKLKSKE